MPKFTCDGVESDTCPLKENKNKASRACRQGALPAPPEPPCSPNEEAPHDGIVSLERVRAAIWLAKLSALLMTFIVVVSVGIFAFLTITNNASEISFLGELFVNLHAIVMAVITVGK